MNNLDQELDSILHKIGTDINKVYSSNPVGPWCMNHYFKLIKGECVGCEAKQAIQALISDQVAKARIDGIREYADALIDLFVNPPAELGAAEDMHLHPWQIKNMILESLNHLDELKGDNK